MATMWRCAATATVMTFVTLGGSACHLKVDGLQSMSFSSDQGSLLNKTPADEQGPAHAPVMIDGHPFSWSKDCGGYDAIKWHRDPIVRWECFDYDGGSNDPDTSQFAKSCAQINEEFATKGLRCSIDHASFDSYYAKEAMIEKAKDRDDSSPGYYCASQVMGHFTGTYSMSPVPSATIRQTNASKNEFLEKVSSITCVYSEKKAETAELVNKELKFYVSHKGGDASWLLDAMRRLKVFPKLEQNIKEYGICTGGFGCPTRD